MEIENAGLIQIPLKSKNHPMNNIENSKIPSSTTTSTAEGNIVASNHYFAIRNITALQDFVADKFGP